VSVVAEEEELEEEGEEVEAEEMMKRTLKRMGIEVVEGEEELEGEVDRRVVSSVVVDARELAERYGKCRAAYLLKVNWGLKPIFIARLLGANPSTVRSCINYHRKHDRHAELELRPPQGYKRYRELCGENPYSMECQLLEAEIFMFHVAEHVAYRLPVWVSLYLRAASIHRLIFHEVYPLLQAYARTVRVDFKELMRAYRPRGSDFWVVGDGILAYTYTVLEAALHMLGYHYHRYRELWKAVRELTKHRKNPADPKLTPIVVVVASRLNQLLHERFEEIFSMEKELERELLEALRKGKG
jgi:hypothetical protein